MTLQARRCYAFNMAATRDSSHDIPQDDEDAALFRAAIGPVRTLPSAPLPPTTPKPRAIPRMARRDDEQARDEFRRGVELSLLEAGDALSYRRDDLPQRVMRRLAAGDYAVQEELDLHHADTPQAEALLRGFLKAARESRLGCVRIIHGKGLHSESRAPAIKNLVARMLHHRADVLAYHSAPSAQGGSGAVLVLLDTSSNRRR